MLGKKPALAPFLPIQSRLACLGMSWMREELEELSPEGEAFAYPPLPVVLWVARGLDRERRQPARTGVLPTRCGPDHK